MTRRQEGEEKDKGERVTLLLTWANKRTSPDAGGRRGQAREGHFSSWLSLASPGIIAAPSLRGHPEREAFSLLQHAYNAVGVSVANMLKRHNTLGRGVANSSAVAAATARPRGLFPHAALLGGGRVSDASLGRSSVCRLCSRAHGMRTICVEKRRVQSSQPSPSLTR